MSECQREMMKKGGAYPRSCPTCGLFGDCHKGLPFVAPWTDDQPAPEAVKPPAPDKQIRAGDVKPGAVVHVRMKVGDDGRACWITKEGDPVMWTEAVVHVEPRPPEPLKVGDPVVREGSGDMFVKIIAIVGDKAWIASPYFDAVAQLSELEPAYD